MQKLYGLLKLPRFQELTDLCFQTSLEMVEGSLQRYLEISRKDLRSLSDCSMNWRSFRVRCLRLPGINLDIKSPPSDATGIKKRIDGYGIQFNSEKKAEMREVAEDKGAHRLSDKRVKDSCVND